MNILRLVDKIINIESEEESKNEKNNDFQILYRKECPSKEMNELMKFI